MTRSERGKALIADLPIDRLLTETDGPFTETNGRPSHPTDVSLAVDAIARVRHTSPEVIAQAVGANLGELLRSKARTSP
jgi:TatD DNase family protein